MRLPPSTCYAPPFGQTGGGGFSALVAILPYLDEGARYAALDFSQSATTPANDVLNCDIPAYQCPSQPDPRTNGISWLTSYAPNQGEWFVHDFVSSTFGSGAFNPNTALPLAAITDGASSTLAMAEVIPRRRLKCGAGTPATLNAARPADEAVLLSWSIQDQATHQHWAVGSVRHSGMTTCFPPFGTTVDYISVFNASSTSPITYASITSRSSHPGLVHVLLLDGAVRAVSASVHSDTWRALGSRDGGEVVGEF